MNITIGIKMILEDQERRALAEFINEHWSKFVDVGALFVT
jgi:hypothetical protein